MSRAPDFSGIKVLLIDDSRFMQKLLAQILHAIGVREFQTARDGGEGLRKVKEFEPDLVICDWDMEPVDGEQFVRMIRDPETSPDPFVPVILLTGFSELRRVRAARDFGVTDFLAKPVSPRTLYSRLVALIEQPRPFIKTANYFGPCRRRGVSAVYTGPERRSS